jgi:hypothetical protein
MFHRVHRWSRSIVNHRGKTFHRVQKRDVETHHAEANDAEIFDLPLHAANANITPKNSSQCNEIINLDLTQRLTLRSAAMAELILILGTE